MSRRLTVSRDRQCGYAEVRVLRDGTEIGTLDTQYEVIALRRGVELTGLGQPRPNGYYPLVGTPYAELIAQARALLTHAPTPVVGTGDERLAPAVSEESEGTLPGMCPRCHTVCDGDCTAG